MGDSVLVAPAWPHRVQRVGKRGHPDGDDASNRSVAGPAFAARGYRLAEGRS